jgi:hypothetical protein
VRSSGVQAHLGNELVDENDHADGADKAAKERSAKHRVEKA